MSALRRHFTGGPTQWEQVDDAAIEASGKRLAALYSTKTGEDGACPAHASEACTARLAPHAVPLTARARRLPQRPCLRMTTRTSWRTRWCVALQRRARVWLRLAAARYARGAAVLTIALRLVTQGMGWLNQGSLTLSKQRPVGRLRKQKGIFIGASAHNAALGTRFLDAPV